MRITQEERNIRLVKVLIPVVSLILRLNPCINQSVMVILHTLSQRIHQIPAIMYVSTLMNCIGEQQIAGIKEESGVESLTLPLTEHKFSITLISIRPQVEQKKHLLKNSTQQQTQSVE